MSIAIHSSKGANHGAEASAGSRRREAASDAATTERSTETKAPKGRHALMNALSDALETLGSAAAAARPDGTEAAAATSAVTNRDQKEALHAFAHELFNALRPTPDTTVKGHHGRGFAWGRTSLGDLAQRLEALAQKLGGGTTAPADTPAPTTPVAGSAATVPATAGVDAAADAAAASPVAAAAVADAAAATTEAAATVEPTVTVPTPVVTSAPAATVASPLLAAFRQLTAALQGAGSSGAAAPSPADALAALLHRMALALVSDGRADVPASGSLIDVTA